MASMAKRTVVFVFLFFGPLQPVSRCARSSHFHIPCRVDARFNNPTAEKALFLHTLTKACAVQAVPFVWNSIISPSFKRGPLLTAEVEIFQLNIRLSPIQRKWCVYLKKHVCIRVMRKTLAVQNGRFLSGITSNEWTFERSMSGQLISHL